MPKTAATLASLLLIISSIGVNIARYPVVSEMVGGFDREKAAADRQELAERGPAVGKQSNPAANQTASTAQAGRPLPIATDPPSSLATQTSESRIGPNPAAAAVPTMPTAIAIDRTRPEGRIIAVRPIVVATPVDQSISSASPYGGDEVRRLPPVDETAPPALANDDSAPLYPMTRTP